MQNLNIASKDARRTLYEFGEGDWTCAKYLEVHQDSEIGNHYHKEKDECFLLVEGEIEEVILGEETLKNIQAPYVINVSRGTYHKFIVKQGSKIVGLMTKGYDPSDDYTK